MTLAQRRVRILAKVKWPLVGLFLGGAVAAAHCLRASEGRIGGPGFISQSRFEQDLETESIDGRPYVRNIVIHELKLVDVVDFERFDIAEMKYVPLHFAAPHPFVPVGSALPRDSGGFRVREFLGGVAPGSHGLRVRLAWWDSIVPSISVFGGGSALILGLLFATVLRPRLRFARSVEAESTVAGGLSAGEVEAGPSERDGLIGTSLATPARPLAAELMQGGNVEAQADKEYSGEYYPVERRVPEGFSLVELMVVITIIAVLAVLLLPSVRLVRLHAQTVQCATQLRQIGSALQMYANNNNGAMPAWSGWHTWPIGAVEDSAGPAWTIELMPYLGAPDSAIYNCPGFPSDQRCRNYFLAAQWSGASGKHSMRFSDVTMTGRFVLSGDKTQRRLYPAPFGTSEHLMDDADPDDCGDRGGSERVLAWPWDDGGFYMHHLGNNVLFDDLHVALFSNYDKDFMTFNPHRMESWNDVTSD